MLKHLTQKQVTSMLVDALEKELRLWKPLTFPETSPITCSHRSDILEWMQEVCSHLRFYPEAYALAVAVLDKFLSLVKTPAKYLKCAALTCIHIAAKVTEDDEIVPHIVDLVHLSSANCIVADVVRMEMIILNKLEWNVNMPTSLHFLQMYHASLILEFPGILEAAGYRNPSQHMTSLTQRLNGCLLSGDLLQYSPSLVSVALLSLELERLRSDWFPLTLSLLKLTKVTKFSELISCREVLAVVCNNQLPPTVANRRQKKRPARAKSDSHNKRRTNQILSQSDTDDIYDSIKKLYSSEGMEVSACSPPISGVGGAGVGGAASISPLTPED